MPSRLIIALTSGSSSRPPPKLCPQPKPDFTAVIVIKFVILVNQLTHNHTLLLLLLQLHTITTSCSTNEWKDREKEREREKKNERSNVKSQKVSDDERERERRRKKCDTCFIGVLPPTAETTAAAAAVDLTLSGACQLGKLQTEQANKVDTEREREREKEQCQCRYRAHAMSTTAVDS